MWHSLLLTSLILLCATNPSWGICQLKAFSAHLLYLYLFPRKCVCVCECMCMRLLRKVNRGGTKKHCKVRQGRNTFWYSCREENLMNVITIEHLSGKIKFWLSAQWNFQVENVSYILPQELIQSSTCTLPPTSPSYILHASSKDFSKTYIFSFALIV